MLPSFVSMIGSSLISSLSTSAIFFSLSNRLIAFFSRFLPFFLTASLSSIKSSKIFEKVTSSCKSSWVGILFLSLDTSVTLLLSISRKESIGSPLKFINFTSNISK